MDSTVGIPVVHYPHPNLGKTGSLSLIIATVIITAIGAYVTYTSIGVFVTNAVGSTIRSSAKSGPGPIILVIGVGLFLVSLFDYFLKYNRTGIIMSIIGGLVTSAISLPFLIYYNFYFSESEIIAGGTYTVYPYGLQPAIPFMLGLFFSFITWLLYLGTERGKIRIKVPFIRIRKEN